MHLEEDVLFSDMPSDWLWFYLRTLEWHKKQDFYQLTNPPRSWFPSKCSFSDHRGWQFNLPWKKQPKKTGRGYHTETSSLPVSTNILIPVSAAVRAHRVLLFRSCISEPHLCKVTSVLHRDIFTFAQSSPKQWLLTHNSDSATLQLSALTWWTWPGSASQNP